MSLEQALAENTAAIKMLTAALADPVRLILPNPQPLAPTSQPVPTPTTVSVCSTADASLAPTAPGALTVTLLDPTSVFGQVAPPSVPPGIPAAPLMVPPAPAGNTTLDRNGIPWDGRIHASSKALIADGSWRAKRGVDEALVAQVTAELRQAQAAPAGTSGLAGQPWPFATSGADVAPASTFAGLMAVLPGKMVSGELTTDQIAAACASVGVPNLPALAAREDLVPAVATALGLTQ